MSKPLPWYKRDVDAWRGGTRGMSLELRGFYSECLDGMWDRQRAIPKDVAKLAILLSCNPRSIRKLLPQLIGLGKIVETEDGYINPRMESEIEGVDRRRVQPELPSNPKPIQLELSPKVPKKPMISTRVLEIEIEIDKKEPPTPLQGASPFEALKAFESWNATAARCGLAQAKMLTPDRKRKIIARLKDYGSDGWAQALANIERSGFLTGKNDRGWRADLDFLVQPASFSKVHDGGFGNGRHTEAAAPITLKPHEIEMDREIAELKRLGVEF